jgi:hypothetical protein
MHLLEKEIECRRILLLPTKAQDPLMTVVGG